MTRVMPVLLESELVQKGAHYSKARLLQKYAQVDERLVTGQNPASAGGVGKAVAALLSKCYGPGKQPDTRAGDIGPPVC